MKKPLSEFNLREQRDARQRHDRMRAMRQKGMTLQQIGDKYGVSRQRIFAILGRQ